MAFTLSRLVLVVSVISASANALYTPSTKRAAGAVAFFAPNANGGSELDDAGSDVGEPLNVGLPLPLSLMTRVALFRRENKDTEKDNEI